MTVRKIQENFGQIQQNNLLLKNMIQSYKQNPDVAEHYDTIITGSGMESLTTGAILVKI